ncbi:hypothetical protein U5U50_01765 [Mycoplasma sp. 888]|uniref:hypothetical protein n=1 Tax=Mycoplasma sp. 888 TaxID=3108483 RepID=UPI002D7774EF|nr:hypothetical protein [Mycoplasma sp. 888]WRQ25521.1 hypothetical protein U5U50_01765 [Mycoplasma sp. 888]
MIEEVAAANVSVVSATAIDATGKKVYKQEINAFTYMKNDQRGWVIDATADQAFIDNII